MNRVLVAGIAGLAMLLAASVDVQAGFGRKCGGNDACGGGLFSKLGSRADRGCGGGGLLAKIRAKKAADCCAPVDACCEPAPAPSCCEPAPAPSCCEPAPAPSCCEPAPAPSCCEPAPAPSCCAPAPSCCEPAPSCGGCSTPVSTGCGSCGSVSYASSMGGSVISSGCANCSTTMDSGVIMESSAPSVAPPAPAPVADPAADAPSASDAPEA